MRAPNINPWVVAFVVVVTVVMIALAWIWAGIFNNDADAQTTKAGAACPDGWVCAYPQTEFRGFPQAVTSQFAQGGYFSMGGRSIKDRLGSRSVRYRWTTQPSIVGCVRPGGDRSVAREFNQVDISPRDAGCTGSWKH